MDSLHCTHFQGLSQRPSKLVAILGWCRSYICNRVIQGTLLSVYLQFYKRFLLASFYLQVVVELKRTFCNIWFCVATLMPFQDMNISVRKSWCGYSRNRKLNDLTVICTSIRNPTAGIWDIILKYLSDVSWIDFQNPFGLNIFLNLIYNCFNWKDCNQFNIIALLWRTHSRSCFQTWNSRIRHYGKRLPRVHTVSKIFLAILSRRYQSFSRYVATISLTFRTCLDKRFLELVANNIKSFHVLLSQTNIWKYSSSNFVSARVKILFHSSFLSYST